VHGSRVVLLRRSSSCWRHSCLAMWSLQKSNQTKEKYISTKKVVKEYYSNEYNISPAKPYYASDSDFSETNNKSSLANIQSQNCSSSLKGHPENVHLLTVTLNSNQIRCLLTNPYNIVYATIPVDRYLSPQLLLAHLVSGYSGKQIWKTKL